MLFLDALCLFICVVLLNARPMLKSMEYEKPFADKTNTLNLPHLKQYSNKFEIETNAISPPNTFKRNSITSKRKVTSKDLDLKVFDKFETAVDSKSSVTMLTNSVEDTITSTLQTLSTKIYKLHQLYLTNDANFIVNKEKKINGFGKNDISTMPINDDMEFLGTAEIEEVLNDMKQKEIQMILDQEPTIANLITNAVTETSFTSVPYIAQSNIFPGYAFSTFLFLSYPNNSLAKNIFKNSKNQMHNKLIRSIKEDSCTLACNIEEKLQRKLKKTYCKLKDKLSKEYNKEIKEARATFKEHIKKTSKHTSKKVCTLPCANKNKQTTEIKSILKTKLMNKYSHINGTRFKTNCTKSMKKLIEGSKFSTHSISTRRIQTPEDELSMISTFEKLLARSNGNNMMENVILTTQSNFENTGLRKFAKRNPKSHFIQEENNTEYFYKDGVKIPDSVEYTDCDSNVDNLTTTDKITEKYDRSQVTADANYQALSNKISFNDYVNGYKYYLNFQKDNDDEKYSNLVRYQAHKHHNVDDIGKFILTKIPRLPSTRIKRYFVESETLEDQDVSTKSEDSWFKKHFFAYLDTNPSRKFHTSQTVSLKAPDLQTTERTTTRAVTMYTHKKITLPQAKNIILTRRHRRNNLPSNSNPEHRVQDNTLQFCETCRRKKKSYYNGHNPRKSESPINDEMKEKHFYEKLSKHKICKKKIPNKKDYQEKVKNLSSISHRKNGFVNIDLVHRSTGIVKLNKNNKGKSKMQNLFKKLHINRHQPRIFEKDKSNRQQRHIFESLKNIFREKPKQEMKNGLKFFDYKIVTSKERPEEYNNLNSLNFLNVEDIWKQIPTITGDFTYPYYFLHPEVYNNERLFYSRQPKFDLKTKSISFLSGKSFPHFEENRDDVFDVNIITDYTNEPEPAFTVHMKAINNPTLVNTLANKKNAVGNINMKQKAEKDQPIEDHLKKSNKNKLYSINKQTQEKNNNLDKDIENKESQSIFQPARYFKNYMTERYVSGKPILKSTKKVNPGNQQNKDETKQRNKSVIEQWVPLNKVTKIICHTVPFPFSVSMSTKGRNHTSNKLFQYHSSKINDDDSSTLKRRQNKGIYNTKISKPSISSIARVNALPEQYFTTFLPMQINDFHKFLKEKEIDVESVTTPLMNSLPRSLDLWNTKIINSKSKIKESMDSTKKYISRKPTRNSQSLNFLLSPHQNQKNELEFGESVNMINHNQFENSRNQKSIYDRLKRIKSVTGNYVGNILRSQKYLNNIDLDDKMFDEDTKTFVTEKIKHQNDYFTLNDKVSDKDLQLYLSRPNKNRDPLKFSHMSTKRYFPKYFNNNITKKPERVQISGHSYKYDIIYHKPLLHVKEQNSDDKHYADSLIRNFDDDDTYSSVIEKPKVHNIRKTSSHQSQRGTMELRKALLSNIASKKQVKRRKCKLFHTKACKEDIQNKVIIIKNIKNRNTSSIIHEKTKQLLPDIKNYDDPKVYSESKPLHKFTKQKNAVSDRIISKHEKRSAQIETFTATDVAAIEVVVDLMKNTPAYDGKNGNIKTYFDNSDQPAHHLVSMSPKEGHDSNSIQVHIAIPYNTDDKKRSLEPVRLRKVFSAVMSTPVDLEYQIHSLEETTTAQTSIVRDILTPGLYLLVENTNITCPEGNFLLKPIRTSLKPSKLAIRYVTSVTEKQNSSPSSVNIERVSFDKDFIDAVYKAIQINGNTSFNNTYSKTRRSLPTEVEKENTGVRSLVLEKKRNINWNLIKKYFGHDKVCHCRCKANQTMCRECVACNAIITELMFELENLAEYMKQHCTEIQTFFWVNPSGGRKLRDLIHRIDKILNDYYRRVKGKCQGRTCQMISSSIDKRSLNCLYVNNLVNRLSELADNLENVSKYKIFSDEILMSGTKFLNVAKRCMLTRLHKRSGRNTITKSPLDKTILYSLSNIKVNLICNKDFTKPIFGAGNTISSGCENNTNSELYFGDGEMKKMKENRKGIKAFLKNCFIKKKSRKKIQGAKNRVIRNWTAKDQFAKPLQLINQKSTESSVGKVIRHGRKSLDPLENPNFISNKTHKEENITISENDEVKKYTDDYKYKNNSEINGYMIDTDSFSYNINELFRLLNNVDALEAYTTKSIFYLNENVTKKASLGSEIETKTAYTWSKLKTETKPKQNLKVSSNKISSKSTLVTKRGKHRNNGSRTKCLSKATKLNFLNRLKLLEFLLKKDQVKNKTNSPFTTSSENRRLRSHISKYTKHQPQTEKIKNNLSQNDKTTNITTSALLISMDDDNNKFSNELTTTSRPFKKLHSKNASLLSIPTSVPNLIQDEKVNPDNMEGSSENIKDTQFESLNHSPNNCKSGIQKTNKDYTFNYKNILQSLKNIHNNNYTIFDTEPKNYKGIVSKIADQFVIKILPDREINKGSQKCHNCTYTTTSKHNNGKSCLQSVEKKHENISKSHKGEAKPQSTLTALIQSTATKAIQEKKYKDKMKEKDTHNTSNFSLKEADDRNNICDIAATINHVEKMHDSMPKEDFEQYVKSLSCHKYKNMPKYISIKYNTITKHTKYHRKRKTCRKDYKNILKWDWIRDKRSLIVDDTRVELDDYEDNEKSNNTEPHKAAHDVWHNNSHKKYSLHGSNKKDNKTIEIITIRDKHNQKYFDDSKHGVRKRSLLSLNSSRNENDYHRAIDHNKITGLKEPFYELYFKRKGGIYQQSYDRRKRSNMNNLTDLRRDLQNLPPLRPLSDEIFVTMGDPVTLDCHQPGNRPNYSVSDYIWNTERDEMLDHENIVVDGSKVFIRDVAAKNFGTYVCSKGNAVIRSFKVTITSIPSFNIVFTPVYRTDSACTYKELKAVQMLNSEISRECCGKYCSVRIDEPICLKDREDESSYLRPIVVISLNAIPNISCSCECKRNLQCSITRLLISNMPSLAFVKVLIIFDSMSTNKTLTPLHGSKRRSFVTHTLRRKDSNGHYEYRNIATHMEPGNFDLVLLCPAGFYLISEQKICVVCPSNTFSEVGANVCRTCPQGTRAAPGSKFCRLQHLRWGRFVWNANEWSIATFFALALSAFAICYGAIRLWRRACRSQGNNTCNSRGNTRLGRTKPCQKSPRRRSVSPSHVILSRLLRGSMTSSRATDSQENRFELWKEKNTLPPLPPIDFDL